MSGSLIAADQHWALWAVLSGARESGILLMQVFFAAIGASAHIGVVLREGPVLPPPPLRWPPLAAGTRW